MKTSTKGLTVLMATVGASIILSSLQPIEAEAQLRPDLSDLKRLEKLLNDASLTPAEERELDERRKELQRQFEEEERRRLIEELDEEERVNKERLEKAKERSQNYKECRATKSFEECREIILAPLDEKPKPQPETERNCNDGKDNDGDGKTDKDDPDCAIVAN